MEKVFHTEYEKIGNKYYCKFCGKEITPETEIEDYEVYTNYLCSCEGSENLRINKQQTEWFITRQKELKKSADKILNPIRYINEIKELKNKYGIK